MPKRWRCCKCDNGWMVVKYGEANICTWDECRHQKCGGCDEKFMSVPLGPFGGPLIDGEGICCHSEEMLSAALRLESSRLITPISKYHDGKIEGKELKF